LDKSSDEETIVKIVKALIKESQDAMEEWLQRTKTAYQFYMGNQWLDESGDIDEKVPSYRFRTTRDLIFQTVETLRPLMTDSRPRIIISADYPRVDADPANLLTEILTAEHERRVEDTQLSLVLADALICGKGYKKFTWDAEKDKSVSTIIPPWCLLVDPYGTLPDFSDHKYVIHQKEMDAEDVVRKYGVSFDDIIEEKDAEVTSEGLFSQIRRFFSGRHQVAQVDYVRPRVTVNEVWYFAQLPIDLESGDKPSKTVKYPYGRVIATCGKKLLHLDENPYWHGRVPLVAFHDYLLANDFLGFGEVHHLRDAQVAINILISQIIMNAILMSNAQWIYEKGAVPRDWLTNEPGLNIAVERGMLERIRKEPGVSMPPYVHQMALDIERHAERISSVSEVSQGRQPGSSASGVAIAGLQQAALGRTRHKTRLMEESYRQCGRIEVSNLQQYAGFYDPRQTNDYELGEWMMWEERMRNLMYDIEIESMAELPHNLEGKLAFAFNMLDRGVFDIIEFLEFTNLPISDRLREQHEMMAQQVPMQPGQQQATTQEDLMGLNRLGQGVSEGTQAVA